MNRAMTRQETIAQPLRTPNGWARRLGLIFLLAYPALAGAAQLDVQIEGVQNNQGRVRVVLYDQAEGFRKEKHSRAIHALPAVTGTVSCTFRQLPPGRYAVVAYHDENSNDKLDLRFGMFPLEGHGLSNNPTISGPPKFKDAAFEIPEEGKRIAIHLAY